MCKVLGVSRSGYYAWLKNNPTKRAEEDKELMNRIKDIHKKSHGTYGIRRVVEELKKYYVSVSRRRVARLMKEAGIRGIARRKFKATTDSMHSFPVAENLLGRDFSVERANEAWVSDITYIRTREGWLYLTVIIDLITRKVIGWSLSSTLSASDTVVRAWKMAVSCYPVNVPLIFHSDRGVQYACNEFRGLLSAYPLVSQSMSRKGDCWDNAVAESFFKTLKSEWVYHRTYETRKMAELSIFEYIETWYNTQRSHSSLNYLSPCEYELFLSNQKNAA
jgi:transposase InsO family protein